MMTLGREFHKKKDEPLDKYLIGKVDIKEKIIDLSCGNKHALALTINGRVYSWGENNVGQVKKYI